VQSFYIEVSARVRQDSRLRFAFSAQTLSLVALTIVVELFHNREHSSNTSCSDRLALSVSQLQHAVASTAVALSDDHYP
jgi:hypothetical protein